MRLASWRNSLLPRGNVGVISTANLLSGLHLSALMVILQPFALSVGVSMTLLGFLQGIGSRFGGVLGSVIQPIGGWLSDRRGRRPVALAGSALVIASLLSFSLSGLTGSWFLLMPGYALLGLSLVRSPAVQSTIAESVEIGRRSMAYSTVTFFAILPATFMTFLGGYLADVFGYSLVFLGSVVVEASALAVVALYLRETLGAKESSASVRGLSGVLKRALVPPQRLRGFYVTIALDAFSWGLGATLLYGLLRKAYGFSNLELGAIAGVWSIVFAATQLPVGILIQRFGCKNSLILSEGLGLVAMTGWLVVKDPISFAALSILNGLVAPTWVPAVQTILANSVPSAERAEAAGRLAAFRGLVAFPAPLIGGFLFDSFGFSAPILAGLIGTAITLALIASLVREPSAYEAQP